MHLSAVLLCCFITMYSASAHIGPLPPQPPRPSLRPLPKCPKPQKGGWSHWMRWSPCSETCGSNGVKIRQRYCDNPQPKYGGAKCHGPSTQQVSCSVPPCPIHATLKVVVDKCKDPCRGFETTKKVCVPPLFPFYIKGLCYTCPPTGKVIKRECWRSTCIIDTEYEGCQGCKNKAQRHGLKTNNPSFVGIACRAAKDACKNRDKLGMYPANDWFFLHCSPDGPWCKPCATKGLVYNAKCKQCETTRKGPCTGPKAGKGDEEITDDDY